MQITLYLKEGETRLKSQGPVCPTFLRLLKANRGALALFLGKGGAKSQPVKDTKEWRKAGKAWEAVPQVQLARRILGGTLVAWAGLPPEGQGGLL